jgi:hypothetical protein
VAGRTDTFLDEQYRRITKRRGKKRAMAAVGRSILVIVWHLLANDDARFTDLGPDHFTRHLNPDRQKRNIFANSKRSATPSPRPPNHHRNVAIIFGLVSRRYDLPFTLTGQSSDTFWLRRDQPFPVFGEELSDDLVTQVANALVIPIPRLPTTFIMRIVC